MIPMPARPWPIWLVAWLVLLSFPLVNLVYWPEATRSGNVVPEAAQGSLLLVGSLFFAPFVMMPVMFFATNFAVEDYDPGGGLLVWRTDRPVRTIVVTLLCGVPALWIALALIDGFPLGQPWFEWLWVPFDLLCIAWLLLVRAAAINRRPDAVEPDIFA